MVLLLISTVNMHLSLLCFLGLNCVPSQCKAKWKICCLFPNILFDVTILIHVFCIHLEMFF